MFPTLWFGGSGGIGLWTPASLSNLVAWYTADIIYCYEDVAGVDPCEDGDPVAYWKDRSGGGNHLTQSTAGLCPTFHANGWDTGVAAVDFDGGDDVLQITGSPTLITAMAGSDKPFSVFTTLQIDTIYLDTAICCWDDTTPGSSLSLVRTDNPGSGRTHYTRTDASGANGASNALYGTVEIGTGHVRLGYCFDGAAFTTYVEDQTDIVAASSNVGSLTLNRFRLGDGVGMNLFNGRFVDLAIYSSAKSALDFSNYRSWSWTTFMS